MDLRLVVPAAGSGSRLGGQQKQFRLLGGKPLLIQSIRPFVSLPSLRELVVATDGDHVAVVLDELKVEFPGIPIKVVEGGETRQDSVRLALNALSATDGLVAIHDAVRPFVTADLIDRLFSACTSSGAACPAVPVSDTLRRGAEGTFGETVDRSGLFVVQTPQLFRADAIIEAHRRAADLGCATTDDVALYQQFVGNVSIVEGSSRNFKITRPEDWEMAGLLWPSFSESNRVL